jgi:signal transduction histidine kinase
VQECLTNIRRHTNSETAKILLSRDSDRVLLCVRDEGSGKQFSLDEYGEGENIGVGIPGMRHRMRQLGGELQVSSDINGATVTAVVPVRWISYDSSSVS